MAALRVLDQTADRRQGSRQPINVACMAPTTNPTGSLPVETNLHFAASSTLLIAPGNDSISFRPTSATFTLASSGLCTWLVRARSNGAVVYESRPFTTCNSSLDVVARAPKGTDYNQAGTAQTCWAITADFGDEDTHHGTVAGVAMFGLRGTITGTSTLELPESLSSYEAKSEDISPQAPRVPVL